MARKAMTITGVARRTPFTSTICPDQPHGALKTRIIRPGDPDWTDAPESPHASTPFRPPVQESNLPLDLKEIQ